MKNRNLVVKQSKKANEITVLLRTLGARDKVMFELVIEILRSLVEK